MRTMIGCCCNPPVPYTTRKYDVSDGSTLWIANYFQDSTAYGLKYVNAQCMDSTTVYVGGDRVADLPILPTRFWNVVAFDKSDGSVLWEADANDLAGRDGNGARANVLQMQIDPDGNLVVMLDCRGYNDVDIVVLDPSDGTLVAYHTFTIEETETEHPVYALGFTINAAGDYHILGGQRFFGHMVFQEFPFMYEWISPFSSPPTFHDLPYNGGDAYRLMPVSITRFNNRDYIGGSQRPDFGDVLEQNVIGALVGPSQSGAIQEWGDIEHSLPLSSDLTADTFTATGTNQSTANTISANKNYTPGTVQDKSVKLPTSVVGDRIYIQPMSGGDVPANYYNIYPATDERIVVNFGNWLAVNDRVEGLGRRFVRLHALGDGVWLCETNEGGPSGHLPFADASDNVFTTGFGGYIFKWDDAGKLLGWTDCQKRQAIADGDGNTYGFGPRYLPNWVTISKRDSDGAYVWGHRHMSTSRLTASCMGIDNDGYLICSGYNTTLATSPPFDEDGGPIIPGMDRDNMPNPCAEPYDCEGECRYGADDETTDYFEILSGLTNQIGPYDFNCRLDIVLRGGSGGGGGSAVAGIGGGGGGQGGIGWITIYLHAGAWINIECGHGGAGGAYDIGDSNGSDGSPTIVTDMFGDVIATVEEGKGGLSDGTKGDGGPPVGEDPPIDFLGWDEDWGGGAGGDDGEDQFAGNGGDGGGAVAPYGQGGFFGGDPATNGGGPTFSDKCGGGGAASISIGIPGIGEGVGGDGSSGGAKIARRTWIWTPDPDNDCGETCECPEVGPAFYRELGYPINYDDEIYVNCV